MWLVYGQSRQDSVSKDRRKGGPNRAAVDGLVRFFCFIFYFFLQRRIRKRSYQQELFIGEGGFYGGIGRLLPESVPLRLPWSSWAVVLLGGCREDFLS